MDVEGILLYLKVNYLATGPDQTAAVLIDMLGNIPIKSSKGPDEYREAITGRIIQVISFIVWNMPTLLYTKSSTVWIKII